jgi:anti-sigma factor RsiW
MECRDVRELSDSFLAGELQTETNHAILHHVEGCPACRAEMEGRRLLRGSLRAAFERAADLEPRPDFIAGLSNLRHRAPAAPPSRRRAPRWLAIAATLALVTVGGYRFFEARLSADPLQRAAAGDHRYCALGMTTGGKRATEIMPLSAAADRYEPGFHVLEAVPAAEIPTPAGPARVLNRHSCVFDGRRFAHIVLQYRGTKVSLIVTRGASASSAAATDAHVLETSRVKDLTVMSLGSRSGYSVFVIGGLPAAELGPLADAVSEDVINALRKM